MATLKNTVIDDTGFFRLPAGTTAQRPVSPSNGMIRYNTDTSNMEVYNNSWGTLTPTSSVLQDGLTYLTAATSATILKQNYPNLPDGAYWYKVPNSNNVVKLYTDMTRDGGGWVLVSKWGGGGKTIDTIYNAAEYNSHLLITNVFSGITTYSRLSRVDVNSIWSSSKYVVRIHFKNDDASATSGVYFQRKMTNQASLDFWKSHYSPLYWSDFNLNSYQAIGGGTYYEVCYANSILDPLLSNYSGNSSAFNPTNNDIIGGTGLNAPMGWWDRVTVNAPNLGNFEVGRHMGFFGDISSGNQWIFTNNPEDSRFPTTENRQSMIFLRF
jgi:hypothetical protein